MNFNDVKDYIVCPDGEFAGDFVCSNDCFVRVINVETRAAFDDFVKGILNKDSFELYSKNELDGNVYFTFKASFGMLHAYYTDYSKTVRLVFDSLENTVIFPKEDTGYEKVTDPTLTVMSLDYGRMVTGAAYGMSYVFTLSDGSYIIYDGGLWGDADHLVEFLEENNKRIETGPFSNSTNSKIERRCYFIVQTQNEQRRTNLIKTNSGSP